MKTYTIKSGEHVLAVKAAKAVVEKFESTLYRLTEIESFQRELHNHWNGRGEYTADIWVIGSKSEAPVRDFPEFCAKRDAFFASLPAVITADQIPVTVQKIKDIFDAHVPIVDKRTLVQA